MKLITINTAEVIAEMLCYMKSIINVSSPVYDYEKGIVTFSITADRGTYCYQLDMIDIIKLHDYKISQFAYSLVKEYYEERSSY